MDRKIKDVNGNLSIKDGRIYLQTKNTSVDGATDFNGSVGMDMTLSGRADYTMGNKIKEDMLKKSQYSSLLFDDNKNLVLAMTVGGTVSEPKVAVDFKILQERLTKNAQAQLEKEVRKAADDAMAQVAKQAQEQLKKELESKRQSEGKKLEDEAKKQLKNLFK